jgi:hypothetical protein
MIIKLTAAHAHVVATRQGEYQTAIDFYNKALNSYVRAFGLVLVF